MYKKITFKQYLKSVSYTHLDVYKRQFPCTYPTDEIDKLTWIQFKIYIFQNNKLLTTNFDMIICLLYTSHDSAEHLLMYVPVKMFHQLPVRESGVRLQDHKGGLRRRTEDVPASHSLFRQAHGPVSYTHLLYKSGLNGIFRCLPLSCWRKKKIGLPVL